MGVVNRNRAVAALVAAIAGFGSLAGLVISVTTTSVNAGAGAAAGSGPGAALAAPAASAGPPVVTRPSGDEPSPGAVSDPHATAGAVETTAARHVVALSSASHPPSRSTSPSGASVASSAPTSDPSDGGATTTGTDAATACRPGDVSVSTSTDAGTYQAGAPVRITTTVRDVVACVFDPAAPSSGSGSGTSTSGRCATTVAVTDAQGDQVWPVPGQVEQCAPPPTTTLVPGQTLDVSVVWTGLANLPGSPLDVPAPPGQYQAVGTWSWSGPAGSWGSSGAPPVSVSATSAPFTLN